MSPHATGSSRLSGRAAASTRIATLALAAAAAWAASGAPARSAEPAAAVPLQATLEVLRPFTYEGEPVLVRVAVFNTGEKTLANGSGIDLLGGLKVVNLAGTRLSMKGKPQIDVKQQPAAIPAGGFFGIIQDITPMIPDLSRADTYSISWEGAGVSAAAVVVKVLPRFDPTAAYVAVVETDFGYLEFDLLSREAPKHVQNFYDLAMQGYYDNTVLHHIMKGVEIRGGDPAATGAPRPGYSLELEITNDQTHRRGTLSMLRLPGQNLDDPTQFVITLGDIAQYDGSLSIFGQLRKGEETLAAIEGIPTTGQFELPHFRPLKPVVVRSIRIVKAETRGGGAPSSR